MYEQNVIKIEELTQKQNTWRSSTINLIASENVLSQRARNLMGSDFAHRYAEGHPGGRYYQGTAMIDAIETSVTEAFKQLFHCRQADVRPISGNLTNDAVFSTFIKPGDVVMVNSTPGGGHISHHRAGSVGKYTSNIVNFPMAADGYHMDVDKTIEYAKALKPKVMVLGKSLFLFPEPVKELAEFCQKSKITLIYDGAHVLGLIAGGQFQDPLAEGALILNGSTHKTFFGSQRGVVMSNFEEADWKKVDRATFPGASSNHHLHTLAVLGVAVYEMLEFGQDYARQTIANAKCLGQKLYDRGFKVQAPEFGFTQSHQIAVDVSPYGNGAEVAKRLEDNNIITNMNLLPFEPLSNVTKPSGIRIGAQEMTRFGMKEAEMETIAEFFKLALIDGKSVAADVEAFRKQYQHVHYSFDIKK